jgi:phosphoribosylformylglycinamidine synthase
MEHEDNTAMHEARTDGLDVSRDDLEDAFLELVASPAIVSKPWVAQWRSASFSIPTVFADRGDIVVLVGETTDDLAGSQYLGTRMGRESGELPRTNQEQDRAIRAVVRRLGDKGLIKGSHACGEGGLVVALAECAVAGGKGVRVALDDEFSPAASLFAETPSRVLVTVEPAAVDVVADLLDAAYVPYTALGVVGTDRVRCDDESGHTLVDLPLEQVAGVFAKAETDSES